MPANPNESYTTPDVGQIDAKVTSAVSTADGTAAQRVASLKLVYQARVSRLTRTVSHTVAQYGANDPRTNTAQADLSAAKTTAGRVAMLEHQVNTTTPQVDANGWVLHGRVFGPDLQPLEAYTVFLVDAQKAFQPDYGFSYTDSSGYFQLNYLVPQTTGGSTTRQPAAPASSGSSPSGQPGTAASQPGTPVGQATASTSSQPPQLFIAVTDTKAQPVYLSKNTLQPDLGNATYQSVVLPASDQPIGDPPADIRNIALPPQKK